MQVILALLSGLLFITFTHAANIAGQVNFKRKSGKDIQNKENIVIFIDEVRSTTNWAPAPASMASAKKEFVPGVVPIVVGSEVTFPNDDKILHNVFSLSKTKVFDLGLYKKGEQKTVKFDKTGLVKVYCNIHENMVGYVLSLQNPYFAKTDKQGKFLIQDVPDGDYTITAWHAYSTPVSKPIKIAAGGSQVEFDLVKGNEVEFDIFQDKQPDKHKNKWGKEYKAKY